MEITQVQPKFEPITLVLKTREEAKCFFDLIDRLEGKAIFLIPEEKEILILISDALTNGTVTI